MEELVKLVGHLAWPLTTLFIVYNARKEIYSMIDSIAKRIKQESTDVEIGKEGIKLKSAIAATQAKIDAQDIDLEQVKSLALQIMNIHKPEKRFLESETKEHAIDDTLMKMAEDYLCINIEDWSERVRAKDAAARNMGNYIITNSISKDLLASQKHEGLVLALATTIHSFPEAGDIERLLKVSDKVNRFHVKYAIVMAFARLFERRIGSVADISRVRGVLNRYEVGGDTPLVSRINGTRAIINQIIHGDN